jgi:hypothetical protein
MHWGVRRYQNKDGSLTAAGRERYAKQDVEKLKRARKMHPHDYDYHEETVRNTETYKKAKEEVKKKIGDSIDYKTISSSTHEEVDKFLGKHKKDIVSGSMWTASNEISRTLVQDIEREQAKSNTRLKAIKSDLDSVDLLYNDKRNHKSTEQSERTEKAIDFGMKVYNEETLKRASYYGEKMNPKDKMDRIVFSNEDWTVGWTTVADLARRGYSKKETMDIIKKCKEYGSYSDDNDISIAELWDDNGSDVEAFANDCYNYLDKHKKG